ncbi:hypothetical protein BN1013_02164 [Candidatus Rubidus massiliensis]|nr:hypothetical protein BN1013_02164 [Candidatus Rubidus massiliensis]
MEANNQFQIATTNFLHSLEPLRGHDSISYKRTDKKIEKLSLEVMTKINGIDQSTQFFEIQAILKDENYSSIVVTLSFMAACQSNNIELATALMQHPKLKSYAINFCLVKAVERNAYELAEKLITDIRVNPFGSDFALLKKYTADCKLEVTLKEEKGLYLLVNPFTLSKGSFDHFSKMIFQRTNFIVAKTIFQKAIKDQDIFIIIENSSQNSLRLKVNFDEYKDEFKKELTNENLKASITNDAMIGYMLEQLKLGKDIEKEWLISGITYLQNNIHIPRAVAEVVIEKLAKALFKLDPSHFESDPPLFQYLTIKDSFLFYLIKEDNAKAIQVLINRELFFNHKMNVARTLIIALASKSLETLKTVLPFAGKEEIKFLEIHAKITHNKPDLNIPIVNRLNEMKLNQDKNEISQETEDLINFFKQDDLEALNHISDMKLDDSLLLALTNNSVNIFAALLDQVDTENEALLEKYERLASRKPEILKLIKDKQVELKNQKSIYYNNYDSESENENYTPNYSANYC